MRCSGGSRCSRVVVVSSSDLSEYGFKHDEHYISFKNAKQCAFILDQLFEERYRTDQIQQNMRQKLKKDFYMPDLLKAHIEKII